MSTDKTEKNRNAEQTPNKYFVGPGIGLIIMGVAYIAWWFAGPWAWEAILADPRWAHNWAYAIIILNVGLAWYHKSAVSRTIAMLQSIMLPIVASGSFNSVILTIICVIIFVVWVLIVLLENMRGKLFFQEKLSKRSWLWLTMHTLVIAWILIAHMGLMFFIVRLPQEANLMSFGIANQAGYLANLPPESLELATWTFDIGLFVWGIVVLWEQFKLGYNVKNNPWPKYSFMVAIIIMVASLLALLIQDFTIGFDWVNQIYS